MRGIWTLALLAAVTGCSQRGDPARGERIATITGCTSCHNKTLDGHLFEENPQFALAWSSNLSRILPRWTDAQVERTLRTGKRPDGSALWFMPTFAQQRLGPDDMRDLVAWLRTGPSSGVDHPPIKRGPLFAQALAAGMQDSAATAVRLAGRAPVDAGPHFAQGRYLAQIACAECHGPDLKGPKEPQAGDPPDLSVAAAYSPAAFGRLLRTGIAASGKPAGLMAQEAPKRLSALSDEEVNAIRDHLVVRAGK